MATLQSIGQIRHDAQLLTEKLKRLERHLAGEAGDGLPCVKKQIEQIAIGDHGEVETTDGEKLSFKAATFAGRRLDDCEWSKESITIYSNGNFIDVFELKDNGILFGDRFITAIKLQNREGHAFYEWTWEKNLNANETLVNKVAGHSEIIKDSFNDITLIERERHIA